MNFEDQETQFDLAQALHNGHLRRSADLGLWLRHYLRKRRHAEKGEVRTYARNKIISFIAPLHRRSA